MYLRVSTLDQHPKNQTNDLEQLAAQRGYQIVQRYTDHVSGTKGKRPGLDQLLHDASRHRFDIVLVWAFDRMARSTRHFLEVLDQLNHLNIEFISFRENIDTGGPLGRALMTIIGAIAELERNLIIERVRVGMRRARLEGRHIGRKPIALDHQQILRDRAAGRSLGELAKLHRVSRTTVGRIRTAESRRLSCTKRGARNAPLTATNEGDRKRRLLLYRKVWISKHKDYKR